MPRYDPEPSADANVGRLPEGARQGLVHWADVARWVGEDEERFTTRGRGWLLIHHVAGYRGGRQMS